MITITVNSTTNLFEFLSCVVSWKANGVYNEQYTNEPSVYEDNIRKYSGPVVVEEFKIKTFEPSEEQKVRLKEINEITSDIYKHGFIEQVNEFVNTGYIDNTYPDIIVNELFEKYKEQSKKILLEKYSKELASIRYDKEVSGIEFMGKKVKTDRESQSTITSTVVLFTINHVESIDFKCDNNEWLIGLNKDTFMLLALAVSGHVNACFKTETMVNDILASYSMEKLVPKSSTGEFSANNQHVTTKEIKDSNKLNSYINTIKKQGYTTSIDLETTSFNFPVIVETNSEYKFFIVVEKEFYLGNVEQEESESDLNLTELYNQTYTKVMQSIAANMENKSTTTQPAKKSKTTKTETTDNEVDNG